MKKRICLILAVIMALVPASVCVPLAIGEELPSDDAPAAGDNTAEEAPVVSGEINYSFEDINRPVAVLGFRYADPISYDDGFFIDLQMETLSLPETYRPAAFSINNGAKWRPAGRHLSASNFPRLLNRGMTLLLSDRPVDRSTGLPPDGADIVRFAQILERPAPPRLIVNYTVRAAVPDGAEYPGRGHWALTEPGGTEPFDVQIAGSDGSRIDESGFGMFFRNPDGEITGIPVAPGVEVNGRMRVVRSVWFWRLPPLEIDPGELYQAAGRTRRVAATSERRPSHTYEEIRREDGVFIMCTHCAARASRVDLFIIMNGVYAGAAEPFAVDEVSPPAFYLLNEHPMLPVSGGNRGIFEGEIIIWRPATERRAATAPQVLSFP
jgi:hypothetical protein